MSATVELEAGKPFNVRKRVGGVFCFVFSLKCKTLHGDYGVVIMQNFINWLEQIYQLMINLGV